MIISIVVSIIVIAVIGLFLYTYRWNILNPNKTGSFKIDNLERKFIFHLPKKLGTNPKLIIIYHGVHLKSFMMQMFTGHEFDILADQNQDAIIVYPQGYKDSWNDCRTAADYPANKLNLDDVGFTEKIIGYFQETYNVDTDRMYAVGFSNGGQMVMKLANLKPGLFKGYAVISANLSVKEENACTAPQQAVSLIYLSGVADPIIPHNGGEVLLDGKSLGNVVSTDETLTHWLNAAECDKLPATTKDSFNKKSRTKITATRQDFYSINSRKKVSYIKMLDGGHTIPNKNFRIPMGKMGNMNKEIDAPAIIWDFFNSLK